MFRLTQIHARNFMGAANLTLPLGPLNAIHGENAAGKTRILNAVRLLLVGHLPELGKKPSATFRLASGGEMEVCGTFESDSFPPMQVRRRWWLQGDSVRSEHQVPEGLGAEAVLTVMLNAEEYFGLSDRDRVAYVFRNVGVPGLTLDDARARLRIEGDFEPEDPPPAEGEENPAPTPQALVEHNLERAREGFKRARETARRMEESVRGVTQLRLRDDGALPPRAEIEGRQAEVAADLADLNQWKGGLMGDFLRVKEAAQRRAQIEREVQTADKDERAAAGLRERERLLVEQIGALGAERPVPALEDLNELQEAARAAGVRLAGARRTVEDGRRRCAEVQKRIEALNAHQACPYCGANGSLWRGPLELELKREAERAVEDLGQALDAQQTADSADQDARAALELAQAAFRRSQDLQRALGDVRRDLAQAAPRVARIGALRAELAALPPPDPALQERVDDVQARINAREQEARNLERILKEIGAREGEVKRLAEAEAERDRAKQEEARWKRIGEHVLSVQEDLVARAFGAILDAANAVFPMMLRAPLAYHRGEVGFWLGARWVGHATFSGTERALAYAAIQAALAARSPCRVVVLDELGRLTTANLGGIARLAAAAAAEGRIDQFFGVDPERTAAFREAGFRLIEVRKEAS